MTENRKLAAPVQDPVVPRDVELFVPKPRRYVKPRPRLVRVKTSSEVQRDKIVDWALKRLYDSEDESSIWTEDLRDMFVEESGEEGVSVKGMGWALSSIGYKRVKGARKKGWHVNVRRES